MAVEDNVRKAEKEVPPEIKDPLFQLGRLIIGGERSAIDAGELKYSGADL